MLRFDFFLLELEFMGVVLWEREVSPYDTGIVLWGHSKAHTEGRSYSSASMPEGPPIQKLKSIGP